MNAVLVAVAGAGGALARYGVYRTVSGWSFPWPTLAINLVGSFALGLLLQAGYERGWPDAVTLALGTGFLGAFTTFSTFSWETTGLLRDGRPVAAGAYVALSLAGGLAAAAAGYALARSIA